MDVNGFITNWGLSDSMGISQKLGNVMGDSMGLIEVILHEFKATLRSAQHKQCSLVVNPIQVMLI